MMLTTAPIRQLRLRVFGRGLGDASTDLTALRDQFPPSSANWTIVNKLIQNPALLASPIGQGQLANALQAAQQAVAAQANPTVFYTDPSTGQTQVGLKNSLPAGATNVQVAGANLPGAVQFNPAVVQAAAALVSAPAPASSTQSPSAPTALSFSLTNTTRGGQSFQVGDGWTLTITGPAGQPVYIAANHNGTNIPKSQWGVTDSNGVFTLQGSMGADSIGTWAETYYVGNKTVGNTSYQVLQSPGPSGTQSTTPVDLTDTTGAMATTTVDPAPAPADFGVTNPIPWWGWAALAAGALFLMREA